jgi:hypothetical protein
LQTSISFDKNLLGPNNLFQNVFQSLYHLVRMEIGVIHENQIYAFPDMYNRSISDVDPPFPYPDFQVYANQSRVSTSNATIMSEWQQNVRAFNESEHIPVMFYLRPVPRLKALGSAITSVFVSTFAMLFALWTIFTLVAGAFVSGHAGEFFFHCPLVIPNIFLDVDDPNAAGDDSIVKGGSRMGRDAEEKAGIMHGTILITFS